MGVVDLFYPTDKEDFSHLSYQKNKYSPTLVDLYLSEPTGPTIQDLIPTIKMAISQISPNNLQNTFGENIDINPILSKYGRFWFHGDMLYYLTPRGNDIPVKKIEMGKNITQDSLIARVNNQIISLISLEQLRVLIRCHGQKTIYSDLPDKINKYHHEIKISIDNERKCYHSQN